MFTQLFFSLGTVIDYKEDTVTSPWDYIDNLSILNPSLEAPLQEALDILNQCFDRYRYWKSCRMISKRINYTFLG